MERSVCKCHFCGETGKLFVLSSIFLPVGEAVCNDCYNVGRLALDNCNHSIRLEEHHEEKPYTFEVYKVDAFGHKLDCYKRVFKREGNAFRYMRKLAKLYLD